MPTRGVPAAAVFLVTPPLLSQADCDLIRAMIRTNIGPSDLPDTIIEFTFESVSRQVQNIDPNAFEWAFGTEQWDNCHEAAVLFAAASLLPMVPLVSRETFQGYSYGLEASIPVADRIAMLRAQAEAVLAENLGLTLTDLIQASSMKLAPGGRGDVSDWIPGLPLTAWPASSQLAMR